MNEDGLLSDRMSYTEFIHNIWVGAGKVGDDKPGLTDRLPNVRHDCVVGIYVVGPSADKVFALDGRLHDVVVDRC
jgi:hypothetical protein